MPPIFCLYFTTKSNRDMLAAQQQLYLIKKIVEKMQTTQVLCALQLAND